MNTEGVGRPVDRQEGRRSEEEWESRGTAGDTRCSEGSQPSFHLWLNATLWGEEGRRPLHGWGNRGSGRGSTLSKIARLAGD